MSLMNTSIVVDDAENTEGHEADDADGDRDEEDDSQHRPSKKCKFQLDEAVSKLIKRDEQNRKLWDDVLTSAEQGYQVILMSLPL